MESSSSVDWRVRIIAHLDMIVFMIWNLIWPVRKTIQTCFEKNEGETNYERGFSSSGDDDFNGGRSGIETISIIATIGLISIVIYSIIHSRLCWNLSLVTGEENQKSFYTKWTAWRFLLVGILWFGISCEANEKQRCSNPYLEPFSTSLIFKSLPANICGDRIGHIYTFISNVAYSFTGIHWGESVCQSNEIENYICIAYALFISGSTCIVFARLFGKKTPSPSQIVCEDKEKLKNNF